MAGNYARLGLWVFNNSSEALFIAFDTTPTTTLFNVKIAAAGFWECPQPVPHGVLNGIWASNSTGAALVTEVT